MLLSEYVKITATYCKMCERSVAGRGYFYDFAGHLRKYDSVEDFRAHVRRQVEAQIALGEVEPDITTAEAFKVLGLDA